MRLSFERLEERRVLDGGLPGLLGHVADLLPANGVESQDVASVVPERFPDAAALQEFLKQQAIERYGSIFGNSGWRPPWLYGDKWRNDISAVADIAMETAVGPAPSHSETNNQVTGIEEGDIAETDGQFIYLAGPNSVTIVDAQDPEALAVVARIPVDGNISAMYLEGDHLTVLSQDWGGSLIDPIPMVADALLSPEPASPTLFITVIDVANAAEPQLTEQFRVVGDMVDSRMIDGTLYLISQDEFQLPPPKLLCEDVVEPSVPAGYAESEKVIDSMIEVMPIWDRWGGQACKYETQEQYFARLGDGILEAVLPRYTSVAADGTESDAVWLTQPEAIYQPLGDTYYQLLSISAFDVAADDPSLLRSTGLPVDWAREVYVSPENIYIAEPNWNLADNRPGNDIYKFDLGTADGQTDLLAVGWVPGRILNQFSMDEYEGNLRLVTQQGWGREAVTSITILGQQGDTLDIVGQLNEIAPAERLYSVRFMGDRGFLVTFGPQDGGWFDPLFTVDLSDPANPQLMGELQIPGFSNYLQLIGDDFLLGLGRNADSQTGRPMEPQVSLFDVSDLANPVPLDVDTFSDDTWAWSDAFSDHHAISYFSEYGVLAVPMNSRTWQTDGQPLRNQHGLWVFKIDTATGAADEDRIDLLGVVNDSDPVRRSLRIGDQLYSITHDAIQVQNLLTPENALDRLYWSEPAQDDWFRVRVDGGETNLDVLGNDLIQRDGDVTPQIVSVTTPEPGGEVRISSDGLSLWFTPENAATVSEPATETPILHRFGWLPSDGETLGYATFSYTLDAGPSGVSQAEVTVELYRVPVQRRMTELAIQDLAGWLNVPEDTIEVGRVERVLWPDSCLGIPPDPQDACVMALTPGFRITLLHGGDRFVYHTDSDQRVVLAHSEMLPDLVQIRAEVVDGSGQVLTRIEAGESFTLNVYVQDLRDNPEGVYAAYLDLLYYARRVAVDGEIVYGADFPNGQNGTALSAGMLDEIGAFSDMSPSDGQEYLLASIPFVAKRAGQVEFTMNPADEIGNDVLVYGSNDAIPPGQVAFVGTSLEITKGWRNEDLPEDVDNDGHTTPSDVLTLINELNERGPRNLGNVRDLAAHDVHHFLDVNGDRLISAADALWVINRLNQAAADRAAGIATDQPGDRLFQGPLNSVAAWVDWSSLQEKLATPSWSAALNEFDVTPEQAVDLVHGALVAVKPQVLRDLDPDTALDRAWQTLEDLRINGVLDSQRVDRLFEAAGRFDDLIDDLDIQAIVPELGEHFEIPAIRRAFRDKFAARLAGQWEQTT